MTRQELRKKMEQIFAEELSIREAKGGTIRYETVNPGIQGREAFKQRCLHLIDEYVAGVIGEDDDPAGERLYPDNPAMARKHNHPFEMINRVRAEQRCRAGIGGE